MNKLINCNRLYDLDALKLLAETSSEDMFDNPQRFFGASAENYGDDYIFINNNANVLAVAHLDTVGEHGSWVNVGTKKSPKYERVKGKTEEMSVYQSRSDTIVETIQLDDRLGVWVITKVLPKLLGSGAYDILLTTNEEVGASTASRFETNKQYNWIFEFDRRGYGNVVMYQYETHELVRMLELFGYDVQQGTFSDISMMDDLGCAAFNFGVGYFNEHTHACSARLSHVHVCVSMFEEFFLQNSNKFFEHIYVSKKYSRYGSWGDEWDTGRSWKSGEACKYCGSTTNVVVGICDACWEDGTDLEVRSRGSSSCVGCELIFSDDDLADGLCVDCLSNYINDEDSFEECFGCGRAYPISSLIYKSSEEVSFFLCEECDNTMPVG